MKAIRIVNRSYKVRMYLHTRFTLDYVLNDREYQLVRNSENFSYLISCLDKYHRVLVTQELNKFYDKHKDIK